MEIKIHEFWMKTYCCILNVMDVIFWGAVHYFKMQLASHKG